MLSRRDFSKALSASLRFPLPEDFSPETDLYDEIGLDSLQAFEMLIFIEVKADLMVPPPTLPAIYTLGDAYAYYVFAVDLASAED